MASRSLRSAFLLLLGIASCKGSKEFVVPELQDEAVAQKVQVKDMAEIAPAFGVSFGQGQSFEVSLEPSDSQKVRVGEDAVVYVSEERKPISCRVTQVMRSASSEVGQAIAWLKPTQSASVPTGEFVFARVTISKRTGVLSVPKSAIYIKDGATLVLKQTHSKDGKVSYTPTEVEIGVESEDSVQIVTGLQADDIIATQGGIGYLFPTFKDSDDG